MYHILCFFKAKLRNHLIFQLPSNDLKAIFVTSEASKDKPVTTFEYYRTWV